MNSFREFCLIGAAVVASTGLVFRNVDIMSYWRESSSHASAEEVAQKKEQERAARLEKMDMASRYRLKMKAAIIKKVFDGELSLSESARLFGNLHISAPKVFDDHLSELPGESNGEKLCHCVLQWAASMQEDTARQLPVIQNLKTEIEERRACLGFADIYLD